MGWRGGTCQNPTRVGAGWGNGRVFYVYAAGESGPGAGVLHLCCLPHRPADYQGEVEEWPL